MAQRLTLENISYGYPFTGSSKVLDKLNLTVQPGEVVCIAGKNGSGKSTLAQICAGLLRPTAGNIRYGGTEINNRRDLSLLRNNVRLLFQSPEEQLFSDTVYRDISFGPKNRGVKGAELDSLVNDSAKLAGLEIDRVKDGSPFSLSQGEKRMVALSGVFALQPEVLILDEPFTGLDFEHREHLRESLNRYVETYNASLVIITHELSGVWRTANKFAVLSNGELSELKSMDEIISEEEGLSRLGLRMPQWGILALELEKMNIRTGDLSDHKAIARSIRLHIGGADD